VSKMDYFCSINESLFQTACSKTLHRNCIPVTKASKDAVLSVVAQDISRYQTFIQQCSVCAQHQTPHKEPMITTSLPDHPWQKLGSDLFELKSSQYLLVVDYFSRFVEISKLSFTTSLSVIAALKSIFSRHRIPTESIRPQYALKQFDEFQSCYEQSILLPREWISRTYDPDCQGTVN